MDQRTLYTPIVKGKENDFRAIGRIPRHLAVRTFPLIELVPPEESDKLEKAYFRFCDNLRRNCGWQRVSVDLHAIAPEQRVQGGGYALEAVCAMLKASGINFVPVFGFDHEPELWERIAQVAREGGRGLTFRVKRDDLLDPDDTLELLLEHLNREGFDSRDVNLIVDLGALYGMETAEVEAWRSRAQDFIDLAVTAKPFALVSLTGSSMPKHVGDVPMHGEMSIPRRELRLWLDVANSLRNVRIAFGDYGVVHPDFSAKMRGKHTNAKIRYTSARSHNIFRGYRLSDGLKYEQFYDLSKRVVDADVFLQPDYSFGDGYLWKCAKRDVSHGHLGTWVEVDLSHHFVFTAMQLDRVEGRIAAGMSMSNFEAIVQ